MFIFNEFVYINEICASVFIWVYLAREGVTILHCVSCFSFFYHNSDVYLYLNLCIAKISSEALKIDLCLCFKYDVYVSVKILESAFVQGLLSNSVSRLLKAAETNQ